jgi:hypothetical protein
MKRLFMLIAGLVCFTTLPGFARLHKLPFDNTCCVIKGPDLTVADIIQQNVKAGQAKGVRPLGVPHWWDWYDGANRPIGHTFKLAPGFTENVGYGIVHELKGSPQPNHAKVYLGPMDVWLYGADGQWRQVKHGILTGASYRADFKDNASKPWQVIKSPRGQVLITEPEPEWNLHFWNEGERGKARPDDEYVYVRYWAKASDDHMLVACGGDDQYNGSQLSTFGQSNHVLLTTQWQSIVYSNAPQPVLNQLPKDAL